MYAAIGLRDELERFSKTGQLLSVTEAVSPKFEVCALAAESGPKQAVLFENIMGSNHKVVMNTTESRELIATSLGTTPQEFSETYLNALTAPVNPVNTTSSAPACQEIIFRDNQINLLEQLPFLTHHEFDAGPYITAGVAIGEHRGIRNLSYHRMQIRGPRETGFVVVQRHLHKMLDEAAKTDTPFPVAIIMGLDVATLLAAATSGSATPYGFDELGIAGALRGKPVELTPAVSIPVSVPVCAEIVLEGHILPHTLEHEGPFAEFAGKYQSGPRKVFRASALTMRTNAIYQGLTTGSHSQLNIMGLPNEAVILRATRAVVPTVKNVHVTLGGLRKFHAIIGMKKTIEGDPADAIVSAFAGHRDLKQITVVDDDVDIFDQQAVEKAVATRFQPDSDLHIFKGGRANPVDNSRRENGTTARMGIDATLPCGEEPTQPAQVPGRDKAQERLKAMAPNLE